MENPIKMDDLGGKPIIFGNIRRVGFFIVMNPMGLESVAPITLKKSPKNHEKA